MRGIGYSIVAVTGLAGHAYGSWTHPGTRRMWLQHFLPEEVDLDNVRIMTYGYNTKLIADGKSSRTWLDYRRQFIQQLAGSRDSDKVTKEMMLENPWVIS